MTATPSDATAHQHGNGSLTPAAEPATGFDADNLTAADELAIDIGRVAIEASEGVPYGSEPDEFFLAAGKAVFYWLQLNGHRRITTEEAEEIRQVSNCALQYGNIASREAAHSLLARFLETEPAKARPDIGTATADNVGGSDGSAPAEPAEVETNAKAVTRCPICFGLNGSHNTIHERYPAGGGGTNKPCSNSLPAVIEEVKTHCRCVTPDWYHDGLDSDIDGRLCRRCRLRQDIPYRDLVNSPVARTAVSAFSVAALALRNAVEVLDPHEGGDWEHAWQTIADLEDCAGRFEASERTEVRESGRENR